MRYEAVIFDLDGTLINSIDDLADSCNEMLIAYDFPTHAVDAYKYFVGNGVGKLVERALPADKAADKAFSRTEYGNEVSICATATRLCSEMESISVPSVTRCKTLPLAIKALSA